MVPEVSVLFEDGDAAVVVKPVGMPAQPDPSGAFSLLDWAAGRWKSAFIISRLDRPVGGVAVIAASKDGAARLSRMVQTGGLEKTYLALIENGHSLPQKEGFLEHWLIKDGKANRSSAVEASVRGARKARLYYRVLQEGRTRTLVAVRLLTGRHHQIRAQFASLGCPVAGDVKYGASSALRARGIALWSWKLGFTWKKHPLHFSQLPSGKVWEPFLSTVSAFESGQPVFCEPVH